MSLPPRPSASNYFWFGILIMFACRHNDLIESAENTSTSEKESLAEQLAQVNYVDPTPLHASAPTLPFST